MLRRAYVVLAVLIAALYYYGVGTGPGPAEIFDDLEWWQPRGWLLRWEAFAGLADLADSEGASRLAPVLLLWLPPVALVLGGLALLRSALARMLLFWLGLTVCALTYYSLLSDRAWRFFEWRFAAVVASVTLVVAVIAYAPSLLRALARIPRALGALVLLAAAAAVFLLSTEITGTDTSLPFNLSPWPAVTVVGLLLVGSAVAALHLAAGAGLWLWQRGGRLAGPLAGCGAAALLGVGAAYLLLTDPSGAVVALAGAAAVVYTAAVVAGTRSAEVERTGATWSRLAAGVLVGLAIYGSNAAALAFQVTARNETARDVLVALEAYKERHDVYPDRLDELLPEHIDAVPRPRIGLIRDGDDSFRYSNFGDSYALEFASVQWVQCAYSPPYAFAEYDEYEAWETEAEGHEELDAWERYDVGSGAESEPVDEALARSLREVGLRGSWSCAEKPPRMW